MCSKSLLSFLRFFYMNLVVNTGFNTTLNCRSEMYCTLIPKQIMEFMVSGGHWNTKWKRVYQERTMFAIQMQQWNHSLNVHLMNLTSMDVQNLSIKLEVSLMRQTSAKMFLSCLKTVFRISAITKDSTSRGKQHHEMSQALQNNEFWCVTWKNGSKWQKIPQICSQR